MRPTRNGITLIEVLVAIFVAAIGTLSLLVLFPLGALNMAQALKDDRCAQAAVNAAAIADAGLMTPGVSPPTPNPPIPFRTDPNVLNPPSPPAGRLGLASGAPVYIDPFAVQVLASTAGGGGLGGTAPTTSIARVAPSTVNSNQLTNRFFRLQDDLTYTSNGFADTSAGYVNRGGRYTWAYMARTPSSSYPGVSDLSVVVYDGRNTAVAGGEACYLPAQPTTGTVWPVGTTTITIQYSGAPLPITGSPYYSSTAPQLRRGSWILDASQSDSTSPASDPSDIGSLHSFFYRVVGVTDTGTSVILDLETGLVAAINGATRTTPGIIVVMENVANVYERRTGWQP